MNKEQFEKMKGSKFPSVLYAIIGGVISGILIWASITKEPDGALWFLAGFFLMGLIMNLVRDWEIDNLSK